MELIEVIRGNIRSLLVQCNVAYEVTPFDQDLHERCIEEATRRGYPVGGDPSVRTYLREGVFYATTVGAHTPDRPTQIWIALYTACGLLVDEVPERFPGEIPNVYSFNDRFIRMEPHGNPVLDAYADLIRRASDLYRPIASHLITTSTLNFVTGTLLEHETKSMEVLSAAQQYPIYQRTMTGIGEGYGFVAFPREIPVYDYIQAMPEIALFAHDLNDIFSFYKEEQAGETTNQISTLAARANKSKFEVLGELTETTIGLHERIVKILEGSPEACEAFKCFAAGSVRFHFSTPRYRLGDLDL